MLTFLWMLLQAQTGFIDIHPGWWFGALCVGITALFELIRRMFVEDRKENRESRARYEAALERINTFQRDHLLGIVKESTAAMNHVAGALMQITQELERDRRDRASSRAEHFRERGEDREERERHSERSRSERHEEE